MKQSLPWPWLTLAALIVLAGCSSYEDFQRPVVRNYAADLFRSSRRPPEGRTAQAERAERLTEALARWREARGKQRQAYAVGPSDVLRVSIFVPAQPEGNSSFELPVGEDGDIKLPLLGDVDVSGFTTKQIEEKLTTLYGDGYYRGPVVTVIVSEYGSKQILVAGGGVVEPGIVTLHSNRIRLLEAILQAGGLTQTAGDIARLTKAPAPGESSRTSLETVEIDLEELIAGGHMEQNVWVYPGDVVFVASGRTRFFYVLGFVRAPGAYPLPGDGTTISMMDAIAFARGLTAAARADKTYLLRKTREGQRTYQVDLTRVATAKEPDIVLQADDTVIVGTSWGRRTLDGVLHAVGLGRLLPAPAY